MYSKDELKTLCQDSATKDSIKNLQIFKNLENMKIFGKYGNADVFKTKDWSEVYEYEKDPATGFENVKF